MSHEGRLKRSFSVTRGSDSENDGSGQPHQKRIQGSEYDETLITLDEWTNEDGGSRGPCCPRGDEWRILTETPITTILAKLLEETSEERRARESSEAAPWNQAPTIEEITTILKQRATNPHTVESGPTASLPNSIASRQTKAAAQELKDRARLIRWRCMIARFIHFLIKNVYAETNGHSLSCKNFMAGYEVPTPRDVVQLIEEFEKRGNFDVTKEPWQSIAGGKWRKVSEAVCANYDHKYSTAIMNALHSLVTKHPGVFSPEIKIGN